MMDRPTYVARNGTRIVIHGDGIRVQCTARRDETHNLTANEVAALEEFFAYQYTPWKGSHG